MKNLLNKHIAIFILLIGSVIMPLSTHADNYTPDYESAMQAFAGIDLTQNDAEWVKQHFVTMYGSLLTPNAYEIVNKSFADVVYFNDTMADYATNEAIATYFAGLSNKLDAMTVDVKYVAIDHDNPSNVFVHWKMSFTLTVAGQQRKIDSYGMTHARFNEQKQIALYQDFWDGNNGLYHSLPFIGALHRKLTPFRKHTL